MKFRTKLYLSFVALWLVLIALSRIWFYQNVRQIVLEQKRSKVASLATTIAQFVSGDELSVLKNPEDVSKPQFKRLATELLRIRSSDRKADTEVRYIYFIHQLPEDPTQVEITIDVKNPPHTDEYFIRDEIWPQARTNGILDHIREIWATEHLYSDRMGTWLTGIAPVYDSKGQYVTTVAVDISAESIDEAIGHLLFLAITTALIACVVGFILATVLARIATKSLDKITNAVEEVGRGNLKTRIDLHTNDEFGSLAHAINDMGKGLEENERLKLNFVRYVSKHVMEKILSSDVSSTLKGERRKVTVLFSDIRHFATLSEKFSPEEVVSLVNEYLDQMLKVIFANNGTLDKFMGDGIMVEFGAPLEDPEQESRAVKTAIEMLAALKELNKKWKRENKPHFDMGIGINTGFAVVGNIGSEKRMEYTAIGDTVNVASRLEHASKEYKTPILISETTAASLKNQYPLRSIGSIKLIGREAPLEAFTLDLGDR